MPSAPATTPTWQDAARRRTAFYLLVAALLATLFGVLVFYPFAQRTPAPVTRALFAIRDIPAGSPITAELVAVRTVPVDAVPPIHLASLAEARNPVARRDIVAGAAIVPLDLVGPAGGPVAAACPPDRWCVQIPLAWLVAPPPALAEGDRHDLAAYQPGQPADQAGFVATDVEVIQLPGDGESFVFAVTEREALAILYAHANGFQLLALLRPAGG